jgi:hypothetical protein
MLAFLPTAEEGFLIGALPIGWNVQTGDWLETGC